jgi:DNA-binding response OmpR family regulator
VLGQATHNPLSLTYSIYASMMSSIKQPSGEHRVLLVDDEEDILDSLTAGLRTRGFHVDAFRNPLEALSDFRPYHYDTIILDVKMPEMSGFDLARKIWQEDRRARICFFSAFDSYENEALRSFTGKDYCFIKKPSRLVDLIDHIRRHVDEVAVSR